MNPQSIPWEVREKHETDVRGLFERLGWLRGGQVVRFVAATFWPLLEEMGHTSTALEDCACRTATPSTGDTPDA